MFWHECSDVSILTYCPSRVWQYSVINMVVLTWLYLKLCTNVRYIAWLY